MSFRRFLLSLAACMAISTALLAQPAASVSQSGLYEKRVWNNGADSLLYRLLLPAGFDSSKNYPVVFFLHGAGERGADNESQLIHGSKLFSRPDSQERFPAIVVFPQCPATDFWASIQASFDSVSKKWSFNFPDNNDVPPTRAMANLMQLVNEWVGKPFAKTDQVYVMGLSMGGMGTFEILRRMPNTFAAAIPICGGANPSTAKAIRRIPMWVFHGSADEVVPAKLSEDMVMAMQSFYDAADMQFTLYPGVKHNSWDKAFAEPELLPWLFANVRHSAK